MVGPSDIKPAYVVQRVQGPFEKEVRVFKKVKDGDKTRNEVSVEKRTFEYGYMVMFPKGHSIFVESDKELRRLGFDADPALIDMESGDIVGRLGIAGLSMPTKAPVTTEKKQSAGKQT